MTTRGYGKGLEQAPQMESRGTSRSAVSRRFVAPSLRRSVASTQETLKGFLQASFCEFDLVALMIDGIHIDDHVVLVAMGIDVPVRRTPFLTRRRVDYAALHGDERRVG